MKRIKEHKNYVITSAQASISEHKNLIQGIETYAKQHDSEIIILPMIGKDAKQDLTDLNPVFQNYHVENGILKLNNNIKIEQFNIRPYQIDPITGLQRFAQRETTLVLASPKQRLKPIPHSNHKYPKYLVTTGACTKPNYATKEDVSAERRRLGKIATMDHTYGALIVEVIDNEIFHMRHIRANTDGVFVDFGVKYNGTEITQSQVEALVLGDYHLDAPNSSKECMEATYKLIAEMKPKRLILHDFFDGHSVSHWIGKKFIEHKLIQQMDNQGHLLELELQKGYEELIKLSELMQGKNIFVVHSNHHDFLNRYLNEGRFMQDPPNARYAFKLADWMATKDYNNPVEAGYKMRGKLPRNIKFLRNDEDLKIRGYQLGNHGDKGPRDGRGDMTTKENDFGKSITGHVHQDQILRNTYTIGTNALPLSPYYMRGFPTASSHSHAVLYDTGLVQIVRNIENQFRK